MEALIFKLTKAKRAGGVAQVESTCLPSANLKKKINSQIIHRFMGCPPILIARPQKIFVE
jgi:hypothetical protein